jgi:hypothetical protein
MKQILLATLIVGVTACASQTFQDVRLGMTKQQMETAAGNPDGVIASYEADGKTVEIFEYRRDNLWWGNLEDPYWFYFTNNRLVRWARPGDQLRYVATE